MVLPSGNLLPSERTDLHTNKHNKLLTGFRAVGHEKSSQYFTVEEEVPSREASRKRWQLNRALKEE